MKSKIVTSDSLDTHHQIKGVATIALLTYIFIYNLLPSEFWNTHISGRLPEELQTLGVSSVVSVIIVLIFYHSDPLFKGNSEVSNWIRTLYASNLLVEKFNVDIHEANSLWFKYFNQWQHKEHPNHSFLKKSHLASNQARLVYFMIYLSFFYAFIGCIVFCFSSLNKITYSYLILSLIYLAFGCVLKLLNATPKFSDNNILKPASGVWHTLECSFLESRNRFSAEVVSKCSDITEVEYIVESNSHKWIK